VSVLSPTPERQPVAASSVAPGWWLAATFIAIAALVFAAVFRRDIGAAVEVWIDSTAYNHCFLIIPLIAFLLWERRAFITSVSPSPTFWPLPLIPLLSGLWLLAAILDLQEGRQLALVAMFEVVLLVALGTRVFWLLLAPLLFLFFLVPSGAFLVPTLQRFTADFSVAGLHWLQIPVFSDGFVIDIPEGTFEVAEACAGLRFLIASTVFGCFFAVVIYQSPLRRCLFIGLSVAVPILANGLRALGIIVLAHIIGNAAAVEADHILYGWFFFTLVIIILIAIGMTFAQKIERRTPVHLAGWSKPSPWRFGATIPLAILLTQAGPGYAARLNPFPAPGPIPLAQAPAVVAPWRAPSDAFDWRPAVKGADRDFLESFQAPGSGLVIRYVALYRLRAIGNALTTTENRVADNVQWQIARYDHATVTIDGEQTSIVSTEIVSGKRHRLVWSFYVVGGRITASLLKAKLLQARAVLLEREPLAAFVAISASMDDPDDPAERQLSRFLAASQPMVEYLHRVRLESAS
jgi:exosortase A